MLCVVNVQVERLVNVHVESALVNVHVENTMAHVSECAWRKYNGVRY